MSARAVTDLRANPNNPRAPWTPEQETFFRKSLARFGDLGGVVFNRTTGQLVGGHKRIAVFREGSDLTLDATDQPKDVQGTVAHGFVIVDGTRFAYREVEWSPEVESAANLAANRWAAEWEWSLVSGALTDLSATAADLLLLTGFPQHELDNLLAAEWAPAPRGDLAEADTTHPHTIHLTADQFEILQRAKEAVSASDATAPEVHDPMLTDGRVIELMCAEYLSGV